MPEPRAEAFARLFEAVHEGIYIGLLGSPDAATVAANPHLKLIFGYPANAPEDQVRPFAPSRFVDPHAQAALLEALQKDGRVTDYLLRLRRLDGSAVWVEITAHAERLRVEGALRIEALVRDVSERKKLEDQGRDLHQQLLQAEKLAALGQTISGVAHELNNPLATILALAERLSERPVDVQTRRGLETILAESERAARIVRHLLTSARMRQTTRAMTDVNEVVQETLALRAQERRRTAIRLIQTLASDLPPVFADAHQLRQVLLNLVINAEQAMASAHGRGTLIVRTSHDATRDSVALEVGDDGPGIPMELQPKIFDPFFTTKGVGEGTGLGLTVAYAIVQEHGGRISVTSATGSGASFLVELPVGGVPLSSTSSAPVTPPPFASLVGSTVLVVEDEAALAAAVCEALTDAGFVVDCAGDGEEGLRRIASRTYDLIVCDLKMPRVDGIEFYERLSATHPEAKRRIVFVTGDVAGTESETFLQSSGCRWLAKPFRLGDLLRAARDIVK